MPSRTRAPQGASVVLGAILAFVGLAICLLLLGKTVGHSSHFCPVGGGCEVILNSRFAQFLGVPLAWWGAGFYLLNLALLLGAYASSSRARRELILGALLWICVVGLTFSGALMAVQFAVLKAFCPLCTASAITATLLTVTIWRAEQTIPSAECAGSPLAAGALAAFAAIALGLSALSLLAPGREILAEVDGETFTRAQMEEELGAARQKHEQAIYTLETDWVQRAVDASLLKREAARQGRPVEELIDERIKSLGTVTEQETQKRLLEKALPDTPENAREMRDALLAERRETAIAQLVAQSAAHHHVAVFLERPEPRFLEIDLSTAKLAGPADAPAQLVVFSDFQCEHCARLAAVLGQIRQKYPTQTRVAFRHFPLEGHPRALAAAIAAECAAEQGKFWPYHDALFSRGGDLSDATLVDLATACGLDVAAFRDCQEEAKGRALIEKSRVDAIENGLSGTPMLFLNGQRIQGELTLPAVEARVQQALKAL